MEAYPLSKDELQRLEALEEGADDLSPVEEKELDALSARAEDFIWSSDQMPGWCGRRTRRAPSSSG